VAWLFWFVVFVLNVAGIFHEFGHALAALLSGYQVYGFIWFSGGNCCTLLSGGNPFVYFAGGLAQIVVLAFLMLALIRLHPPNITSIWNSLWNGGGAKNSEFYFALVVCLILCSLLFYGYALWEAFVYF
jgi:hypothetical protein